MTVKDLAAQLLLVSGHIDRKLEVRIREDGQEWALHSMEIKRDAHGNAVAVILSSENRLR